MSSMHEVILEFGIQGPPGAGSASAVPDAAALTNGRMIAVLDGEWIDIPPPSGTGDMLAAVCDPTGSATDVYARANHTGTQEISTVAGLQDALDGKLANDADAAALGSGIATDGYVLTADGAGGAAWEAPPEGGGGTGDQSSLTLAIGAEPATPPPGHIAFYATPEGLCWKDEYGATQCCTCTGTGTAAQGLFDSTGALLYTADGDRLGVAA